MTSRFWRHVPTLALWLSLSLYVCINVYGNRRPSQLAGLPAVGTMLPALTGYTQLNTALGPAVAGRCALIHFVAGGCHACDAETVRFAAAALVAAHHGCEVMTVAASAANPNALWRLDTVGSQPIVYLPYAWLAAVPLRAAPTTLLLDGSRRLVWLRVGALDRPSEAALEHAVLSVAEQG